MGRKYTVKEVSKLLNLTQHTIRYYTDKYLILAVKRDSKNNRIFDEEAINWLVGVKYLKECGMSLQHIKEYVDLCLIGNSTIKERYEIILAQQKIAEIQLEEAIKRVDYMKNKISYYEKLLEANIDGMNPNIYSLGENCCTLPTAFPKNKES